MILTSEKSPTVHIRGETCRLTGWARCSPSSMGAPYTREATCGDHCKLHLKTVARDLLLQVH